MKKSVVAILISATLISATVAACGQPTPSAPGNMVAPPQPSLAPPDYRPQEEKQLDEIWRQTMLAIELGPSASPSARADLYAVLQTIEDVKRTLGGIDEARGTLAAVMMDRGAPISEIDAAMVAMEDARQAVLARVGLAQ